MADKREKTISYRRALWFNEHPDKINLAMCVSHATEKLHGIAGRTIQRGDQELKLAALKTDAHKGHFLHITIETPGDSASIVPVAAPGADIVEVGTLPAPNDAEFMDGDAFVYVRGNDVCLCTTGCTDATVRNFLAELFRQAKIRKDADQFDLIKAADLNVVSMINSIGVKEVFLKSTIFDASAHYLERKGKPSGFLSELARVFKADIGAEKDGNPDALSIAVTFSLDGRKKHGMVLGEKRLKQLAELTVKNAEHDDEYVIVLLDGQKITPDEIYVKTITSIDAYGKSVVKSDAWNAIEAFYEKLANSGALEA
jgi:hypothetical protein